MKKWTLLILLALSMFIIVIDTTIMNVSISALVSDLNTTVVGIQAAIACYSLMMASFMLIGSKLADFFGKKRTFLIGIVVFGIGTFSASISSSLVALIIGWSILEGLGSALMMPNIQTLLRDRYGGKDLAFAYGMISAVGAVGAAVGPILGGYLTTFHSWRWAFRIEVVIVVVVIVLSRQIQGDRPSHPPRFDWLGFLLSVIGFSTVVLSILLAQSYGLWLPKQPFMIGSLELTPLGHSIVPFMFGFGVLTLMLLLLWEWRLEQADRDGLFKPSIFQTPGLMSGFAVRFTHMAIMASFLFVAPLLLQLTFEFTAMQTGFALLPMSLAILICAILGARLSSRFRAKRIIQVGYTLAALGLLQLMATIQPNATPGQLATGVLFGLGAGLIASQLLNLILSSVDSKDITATSGLNATFEQLGNSIGVALVGAIMLSTLLTGLQQQIIDSPEIPEQHRSAILMSVESSVQLISDSQLQAALDDAQLTDELSQSIFATYRTERIRAFRGGMAFLTFITLIGLVLTTGLPNQKLVES